MLLYKSKAKIENLNKEFNINKGLIVSKNKSAKIGFNFGVADGSIESQYDIQSTDNISEVLKKLKRKKVLNEIAPNETYIEPLKYYECSGILDYEKRIDGDISKSFSEKILNKYRADNFFEDDKLQFKVKISHDKYNYVDITCDVGSIQVFGYANLVAYHSDIFKNQDELFCYHPNSADPGLLERNLLVKMIFWCLNTDENLRVIKGSPILIFC